MLIVYTSYQIMGNLINHLNTTAAIFVRAERDKNVTALSNKELTSPAIRSSLPLRD